MQTWFGGTTQSVEPHHTPVMVREVLEALRVEPGGLYIDCTVGEGGHASAIVDAQTETSLLGIDLDPEALAAATERLKGYENEIVLARGNFAELDALAEERGFKPADGILFDLGLSSLQVDTGERGFSFLREGPLDMRFDPSQGPTAYEVVNGYPERALAESIWRLGEEPRSRRAARAIVHNRPIETTTQLAGGCGASTRSPARSSDTPGDPDLPGDTDGCQQRAGKPQTWAGKGRGHA